jgi:hypothetical protein
VKVSFQSRESAVSVLAGAKRLNAVDDLKNVYISPDRSPEERAKRKQLVEHLTEKIKKEPGIHQYIQRGKIQSAEKIQLQSANSPTSTSEHSNRKAVKGFLHYFTDT